MTEIAFPAAAGAAGPVPAPRAFALIGAGEAATRALILSVLPIAAYRALGDAQALSAAYLAAGIAALALSLATPTLARWIRRRHLFALGAASFLAASVCGAVGGAAAIGAIAFNAFGAVLVGVSYNAYLMDYVPRDRLAATESLRLFWSAAAWTAGPFLGVLLMEEVHPAAPFVASGAAAAALFATFRALGFGDGRAIRRARPAAPLAHLGRFLRRPRLVGGWALATARSCGWVAFFVYAPVFTVESGLGEKLGGFIVSAGQAYLFAAPLMARWMARRGVRPAVVLGFAGGAAAWAVAAMLTEAAPLGAAAALLVTGLFMVLLDVAASLPFLMAVKPSERTEMSSVFGTFRDVSSVATPAIGAAVLAVAPLAGVFAAVAAGYAAAAVAARRLPRRLGRPRARGRAARDGAAPGGMAPAAAAE
jgi:predicted MFS family arabinose efflux permease